VPALWLSLLIAASAGGASAQSVIGRVFDVATNEALAGSEVRLLSAGGEVQQRALADTAGLFRLQAPLPGKYYLEAELLGFERSRSELLDLPVSRELNVEVRLSRTAIPLDPIRVIAVRNYGTRLSDFYRRAEWAANSGFGKVYTRADIDRINAPFSRLYAGIIKAVDNSEWVAEPRIGCQAVSYLDGIEARLSEIDMIPVNQLEGVEIYVGMQIPPEYLRARGPCAVVLFWTRPGSGGLLTIPRIIAGAIIVTGILLFSRQPP
jgi:hypothetical protein